jgi:hypothetical protein
MQCFKRKIVAAVVTGLFIPALAQAADADLLKRIETLTKSMEQMSKEMEVLKTQVRSASEAQTKVNTELKEQVASGSASLNSQKAITWGGDYQFRIDSLRGETRTYTDVNATFGNAERLLQGDFFANPSTVAGSSTYFGMMGMSTSSALSALMGFSQNMSGVSTYQQAVGFVSNPMNGGLIQGIGGFAQTIPAYTPKNSSLMSNRFGLDLTAKAAENVTVYARLAMYKTWGSQSEDPVTNGNGAPFFADRVGVFDGTLGHVPSTSLLNVDRAYATWNNIGGEDMWFSVGRRPSTHGWPSGVKTNGQRPSVSGVPALLVDYAFDGMTIGYAPDIDSLPGAHAKICYGRGFESGYTSASNSLKDTDMLGVSIVPIDTDPLRVYLQWNRGMNIFDAPTMNSTYFGNTQARANLGDIDWYGIGAMGTIKNVGKGSLNYFADFGYSVSKPNNNVSAQFGFQGLMTGGFFMPEAPTNKKGSAMLLGVRYDLPSNTKIGLEYNRGSKNWITFAPAAYDMWTTKVGTRGDVIEAYVIQELNNKAISSVNSKTFLRAGVQYYDFDYTGSNNWVGAPVAMSAVNGNMMTTVPLEKAFNFYATAEVKF